MGMTDREKVIKGLQEAVDWLSTETSLTVIDQWVVRDALALLEAQEPVEPTLDIRHGKSMWRCGSCSTALQPNQMHAKFCFNCGRAVKWND